MRIYIYIYYIYIYTHTHTHKRLIKFIVHDCRKPRRRRRRRRNWRTNRRKMRSMKTRGSRRCRELYVCMFTWMYGCCKRRQSEETDAAEGVAVCALFDVECTVVMHISYTVQLCISTCIRLWALIMYVCMHVCMYVAKCSHWFVCSWVAYTDSCI